MTTESRIAELKRRVQQEVETRRQELIDLSLRIHASPELAFKEEQAAALLSDYLERDGFRVERGICSLATAFRASAGEGKPVIGLLAEYDALPGLGHGCGHNIIGTASTAAGIAVKTVLSETGGTIAVIGTPAEEVYGGKIIMAERGAFADLDCAMLAHPGAAEIASTSALALAELEVEYFGRAAHAAARPEDGVNALDALIIAYNAISALRQHIRSSARVHGIITDGGKAPNIVPDHAAASFLVRAEEDGYLEELKERVLACFRAGAQATGARLEYRWAGLQYAAMQSNAPLAEAYRRNMESLGRTVRPAGGPPVFSTDMGNVSAIVPAIHPLVAIAPPDVALHTAEFAVYAASEDGHRGLIDAAKSLAMTAVDFLVDSDLRRQVQQAFYGGE